MCPTMPWPTIGRGSPARWAATRTRTASSRDAARPRGFQSEDPDADADADADSDPDVINVAPWAAPTRG